MQTIDVRKTCDEDLDGFEDIWKSSSEDEADGSAAAKSEDAGREPSGSVGSEDGSKAAREGEPFSLSTYESRSDSTGEPPAFLTGLPKPLYLLSIRVLPDEILNEELRRDIIAKSYKSGLVNAVMLEDTELPSKSLMKPAAHLREICDSLGLVLIVENRVDLAVHARADGVVLDQGLDLESTRAFLEMSASKNRVMELQASHDQGGTMTCGVLCGRFVSTADQAVAAEEEEVDFVMVAGSDTKDVDERSLRMELRAIRRATSAHVVATHGFCIQAGGPKMVITAGADGLQIPAQKLYKLIAEQVPIMTEDLVKELPPAHRIYGATFLIAGGTVGAGIIALPVKTAAAGFIPSMAAMAACWLFMVTTAAILLEISLWYGPGTNLTSMASRTLGPAGKVIVTGLYLFIYGATLCAYMAEGAKFVNMGLVEGLGVGLPMWSVVSAFTLVFGVVLLSGPDPVDKVNSLCLAVAIAAYVLLLKVASGSIVMANLAQANWAAAPAALPVMVVAFTFHNIVPSLLGYLGTSQRVMQAIVAGSGIPFVMYFLWELVILGTIAPGTTLSSAGQIVDQLGAATGGLAVLAVKVFSCFAIITSFLGVGLGCMDFLKDLLMREGGPFAGQVSAGSLLDSLVPLLVGLLPPLIVAIAAPYIFYPALEFSGTFRLILFGVLPVMMVWKGRYIDKQKPFVWGGKACLSLVMCIAVTVLSVEWGGRLGLLPRLA